MKAFKAFIKPLGASQRSAKIKFNLISALRQGLVRKGLNLWEGSGYLPDFKYSRVLNILNLSIYQGYTGFTYFHKCEKFLNQHQDAIMKGFWIFQDSEYSRFLHVRRLHKAPNIAEYDCSDFGRFLNMHG